MESLDPQIFWHGWICDNAITFRITDGLTGNWPADGNTSADEEMAFSIEFAQPAQDHLERLRKRDQRIIINAIAIQLSHQADQTSKHRKLLE